MVKTKPRPELDDQKWIFLKKIKGSTGGQVSRWTRFQFQDSERASRKKIWARTAFFFSKCAVTGNKTAAQFSTNSALRLSPTIPPISIPPIYYHSLTSYLFNIFEFKKKSYSICTIIIHIIIVLRGSNGINIAKKRCD